MSRSAMAMMLFWLVVTLGAAPRVSLAPRPRSEPSGQAEGQTDAQQHQPAAAELSREETPTGESAESPRVEGFFSAVR